MPDEVEDKEKEVAPTEGKEEVSVPAGEDFSLLADADYDDALGSEEVETQAEETAPVEEVTEVKEGEVSEGAAESSEGEEAEAPKGDVEAATTEEAEQPAAEVEKTEELDKTEGGEAVDYEAYMEEAQKLLIDNVYGITEEETVAFEDNLQESLPKFAAKLHMTIMQAATQNVVKLLPEMISQIEAQKEVSRNTEESFFKAWPDLVEERETIAKIGAVYHQMYPDAKAEDFIKDVGAQVMVATGKHIKAEAEEIVEKSKPHVPAGVGAAAKVAPKKETNEFALLAEREEL